MGAEYRPDWKQDVTHLLCAFAADTPKIRSAKAEGKVFIVEGDWLDKCHESKQRIPEGMKAFGFDF